MALQNQPGTGTVEPEAVSGQRENPGQIQKAEEQKEKTQPLQGKKPKAPPRLLTIKEGYETADYYSGKSSEINRQLAFAGIAVIWIFKTEVGGELIVPLGLVPAGLLLITGLALDLLQYVVAGEIWKQVTLKNEKSGIANFTVKGWVNVFGDILYWMKIGATAISYGFLIYFLADRIL
jgi:hypothetical protein